MIPNDDQLDVNLEMARPGSQEGLRNSAQPPHFYVRHKHPRMEGKLIWRIIYLVLFLSITSVTQAAPLSEVCSREVSIAREQCSKDQSKGFSVCMQEKLTPDCAEEMIGPLPSWSPDISCLREIERKVVHCDTTALIKQCWRERLSEACMKQVEAGAESRADAACKQELQQAAGPCGKAARLSGKRCLQERLSPKCKEQANSAEQGLQDAFRTCQEAQNRVQQLCGADLQKGQQCYLQHQAELSAACREKFDVRR